MTEELKELNDCYQDLFMKVIELQGKYPSTMIAGSLVAQALRIYKTILNDEEFESMIDAIAKSQSKIEPYYKEVLH